MEKEFRESPESFHLFSLDEYLDVCVDFAELLNPDFYIERFSSQSPKELRIAPDWGIKNAEITHKLVKRFLERDSWQGKFFNDKCRL
jgi:radical SAM superfamily enzyme